MSEYRAVWISFLEYEKMDMRDAAAFASAFDGMADNCAALGLHTLIVHVRPFSDALYRSRLFPTSHLLTGTQGADPEYDPLRVMLEAAHRRGLRLEAWINPYRILSAARPIALAPGNPASRWLGTEHVLPWEGGLYYNPASEAVRALIADGVEELLSTYDVDGVQIDDYFYPSTDLSFDRVSWSRTVDAADVPGWRRGNVDRMVRALYARIKQVRPAATFGISPQGDQRINREEQYADVPRWMREAGHADYVMPQLYWGGPRFDASLAEWLSLPRRDGLSLPIGLGAYRVGVQDGEDADSWQSGHVLADMVRMLRTRGADGFALFRYGSLFGPTSHRALVDSERRALLSVLTDVD